MSIYNYEDPLKKYFDEKIKISKEIKEELKSNCISNEGKIIRGLDPKYNINSDSFIQQGSYAMQTVIQAKDNDYDIDDAIIFDAYLLKNRNGNDLTPGQLKDLVLDSVADNRFSTPPEKLKNCVRIYYNEGHHVDIACLRKSTDFYGKEVIELASYDWKESNPKQINDWFKGKVEALNLEKQGSGSRLRRMIRYIKKFAKSRVSWDMPCGLILTMLVVECFSDYKRDDECLYFLLKNLYNRLSSGNLTVYNLANTQEILTKMPYDDKMIELRDALKSILERISILEKSTCKAEDARKAWGYLFKEDVFFKEEWDVPLDKMNIVRSGIARTSCIGTIGYSGLKNIAHKFHGI